MGVGECRGEKTRGGLGRKWGAAGETGQKYGYVRLRNEIYNEKKDGWNEWEADNEGNVGWGDKEVARGGVGGDR